MGNGTEDPGMTGCWWLPEAYLTRRPVPPVMGIALQKLPGIPGARTFPVTCAAEDSRKSMDTRDAGAFLEERNSLSVLDQGKKVVCTRTLGR